MYSSVGVGGQYQGRHDLLYDTHVISCVLSPTVLQISDQVLGKRLILLKFGDDVVMRGMSSRFVQRLVSPARLHERTGGHRHSGKESAPPSCCFSI